MIFLMLLFCTIPPAIVCYLDGQYFLSGLFGFVSLYMLVTLVVANKPAKKIPIVVDVVDAGANDANPCAE